MSVVVVPPEPAAVVASSVVGARTALQRVALCAAELDFLAREASLFLEKGRRCSPA